MVTIFNREWSEVQFDAERQALIAQHHKIDPAYIRTATVPLLRRRKALLEEWWMRFKPYADRGFTKRIRVRGEFFSRCWEMFIGIVLLTQGHILVPRSSDKGPDIKIRSLPAIWVEAVSCTPGDGADAVPELADRLSSRIPTKEMLLRVSNAITGKFLKYQEYAADNIVKPNEPFVIAVSKGPIEQPEGYTPLILRYLYGIGDPSLRFPIDAITGKKTGKPISSFTKQPHIEKHSRKTVEVGFFENPAHASVSAVIYCHNHMFNHPEPWGSDFSLLRNPYATAPLPSDFLSVGAEWALKDEGLVYEEKQFIAQADVFESLNDQLTT